MKMNCSSVIIEKSNGNFRPRLKCWRFIRITFDGTDTFQRLSFSCLLFREITAIWSPDMQHDANYPELRSSSFNSSSSEITWPSVSTTLMLVQSHITTISAFVTKNHPKGIFVEPVNFLLLVSKNRNFCSKPLGSVFDIEATQSFATAKIVQPKGLFPSICSKFPVRQFVYISFSCWMMARQRAL